MQLLATGLLIMTLENYFNLIYDLMCLILSSICVNIVLLSDEKRMTARLTCNKFAIHIDVNIRALRIGGYYAIKK